VRPVRSLLALASLAACSPVKSNPPDAAADLPLPDAAPAPDARADGAFATGDPSAYASDGSRHVVYVGRDGHIHDLVFLGTWSHLDVTDAASAPPPDGELVTFTIAGKPRNLVYKSADGHVQLVTADTKVSHVDITTVASATPAKTRPSGFMRPGGQVIIQLQGSDGRLYENYPEGATWKSGDLTSSYQAPQPAGAVSILGWTGGVDYGSFYADAAGNVVEWSWVQGAQPLNTTNKPSEATRAQAIAGEIATYYLAKTRNAVYRGSNDHIVLLSGSGDVKSTAWTAADLVTLGKSPLAAGDPAATVAGSEAFVTYRDAAGHLQLLGPSGEGWPARDATLLAKAPDAVGNPALYESGGILYLVYRAADGHVHEIATSPARTSWSHVDLTTATAAP
jgi:hypothetical protein